ncbi:MAG: SDR family oxidoreductase [Alphaproteobacteria bacterium]|nr:SDR family oxidoreductase [Alphaproteobacteria bacterium]
MAIPKNVLVTGAARRIGRAIARDLAAWGWSVVVHYNRSTEDAETVVSEIESAGGRAIALQADLAQEDETRRLIAQSIDRFGPIGCLVNNASRFERDEIDTATRASWDAHIEPNLRAPFVLSQAMAEALPDDQDGVIVNILDQRVWNLTPHFLSYTLSKTGLWTLTRTLALALAPRIRVNGIGPGPTLRNVRQTEAQFRRQQASVPLRRGASSEEVARAVRFIIESPSMTGQMIALDGGQHLGWAQPLPDVEPEE